MPFFAPPLTPKTASNPNIFDLNLECGLLYKGLERKFQSVGVMATPTVWEHCQTGEHNEEINTIRFIGYVD